MADIGTEFDPWSDPAKPRTVSFEEITSAAYRISTGIVKTPCVPSHMNTITGCELFLKCEFLQYTGSCKERGARNVLLHLPPELKEKGVVSASLGNHSQAISYHGMRLQVPTTVVMPRVAPQAKINKCRGYGVTVVVEGQNMEEATHHAQILAKESGGLYINGHDHPDVIAGEGTVGLEILEQVPDLDAVLVPCGGGALLAGIIIVVKQLRPNVLVYGVETEKCASMTHSLKSGERIYYEIDSTIADGLAVRMVGVNSFHNIKPLIDKMIVVTEDWTARAILRIAELEKYIVEGGGAVTVAAVLAGLVPELKDKKVVCVCSGGNIGTSVLASCFERGLVAESRYIKFKVEIPTAPGSLAKICTDLGDLSVDIRSISMENAWLKGTIFHTLVKFTCETSGSKHVGQLKEMLAANYEEVYFVKDEIATDMPHTSFADPPEAT